MNNELMEAIEMLEKEKEISRDVLFDAIESGFVAAYRNHFGKADNVKVDINRKTGEYKILSEREVVETEDDVMDPVTEISLADARVIDKKAEVGSIVNVELKSKEFGRIATSNAKGVLLQTIREEERNAIISQFSDKEKTVVTGIVQRFMGKNISIDLGKSDAILSENEQIPSEHLRPTERVKVYIYEVKLPQEDKSGNKNTNRRPKILVSRTHPELVKKLFESEVTEVRDKTVEIRAIAREAGSRTKIAVWSNNPDVDPVGACVGMNGVRVNSIVEELRGEKIDIINWDENPGILIENALSPAKVVFVIADGDEKTAKVVVPDSQLSLAIGKEGQNARLAAKLTGFKIDIKSETQAKDAPGFRLEDYYDDEDDDYEYEAASEEDYETEEYDSESQDELPEDDQNTINEVSEAATEDGEEA
ncbi:MAG: transcription termination factor NusA [Lachnospiraceae bacterium]|nr:transcription termination factor NusA [Lachnospiraceae bacterium]